MARDDIADFGTYLAEERHASQNTICSYLRDVTQFSAYLREHQSCTLRQAGGEMIQDYMSWMRGRGKSAASVTRFLASVKSFYNFLLSAGAVKANPAKSISADRAERKDPEILTSKEVELFLEQPRCVDAKGYRDHAMLELLYATGIRVSELISLDLKDLNLSAGFIRCASRGKERIIPLYHTLAAGGCVSAVPGEDFDEISVTEQVPQTAEFAVRISGDAMAPYLEDGAVAYVSRTPLREGDVGIFSVNGKVLCRQYDRDDSGTVYLFSLNRRRADGDVTLPAAEAGTLICFGRVLTGTLSNRN